MDKDSKRSWDWINASLLFVAVLTATSRLLATEWTFHLEYVEVLAALGIILGLALGYSRFSGRVSAWLALGYTMVIVPWRLMGVVEDVADPIETIVSFGGRMIYSLAQLSSNQPVDDYILFLTFVCIIYWVVAVHAGYSLMRSRNLVAAVIPAGLTIIIVQTYDWVRPGRVGYLGVFVFLILLLFGRMNYLQKLEEWEKRRVFMATEAKTDFSMAIFVTTFALVLIAWNYPLNFSPSEMAYKAWDMLTEPLEDIKQRFKDAFSALEVTTAAAPNDFYGSNLALGLGNPLDETTLFTVKVPPFALTLPRLYWRGRVYNIFENNTWTSSSGESSAFDPNGDNLNLGGMASGTLGSFSFTTYIQNQGLLYLFPNTRWVSRISNYQYFDAASDVTGNILVDVVTFNVAKRLKPGETYNARAVLLNPTLYQLRETGQNYPEWVTANYLQLPKNMSPRIVALAEEITRNYTTPYDKAEAITNYLRNEIAYTETIPAPPPNTDPIAWFLLDHKQGFCNYYATAEVLMLRSVGIPARLVAGFAQGITEEEDTTTFRVRQKEAHAWPEAFFPGIGWVEFEPTAGQVILDRPEGSPPKESDDSQGNRTNQPDIQAEGEDDTLEDRSDLFDPGMFPSFESNGRLVVVWVIIILAAGLAAFFVLKDNNRTALAIRAPIAVASFLRKQHVPVPQFLEDWEKWVQASPTLRAFEAVNQGLRWLGKRPDISATPAERAQLLGAILPEAAAEITSLLAAHQTAEYNSSPVDIASARRAAWRIRYLAIRHKIDITL